MRLSGGRWGWWNLFSGGSVRVRMKTLGIAVGAALFAGSLGGFAQTEGRCGQTLEAPLRAGAVLTIDSMAAGIEIVGIDQEGIRVSCTADDGELAKQVRLQVSGAAAGAKLTITGPHFKNGSPRIRIEVPRRLNLEVRMAAGEVKVDEIAGDKDIELYAGRIAISSAREWQYRKVNASVGIGEVKAEAYGADKGGFFRTFRKDDANGEYRLHARVTTGEIDLLGRKAHTAAESQ